MSRDISLMGVRFDLVDYEQTIHEIGAWLEEDGQHYLVTPNPEIMVQAWSDRAFLKILQDADLALIDGVGLQLALRAKAYVQRLKVSVPRVTGVDLMEALCQEAVRRHWDIFLLGGEDGVADRLKQQLQIKYQGIGICGVYEGDAENMDAELEAALSKQKIDLLFIAYGAPRQEKWIANHLYSLTNVKVAIGVGGAFDYLAGRIKRAPEWMRSTGLEWAFRLYQQPRRILRMLRLPLFVLLASGDLLISAFRSVTARHHQIGDEL